MRNMNEVSLMLVFACSCECSVIVCRCGVMCVLSMCLCDALCSSVTMRIDCGKAKATDQGATGLVTVIVRQTHNC